VRPLPTEDVVSEFGVVRQHVRRLVLWLVVLKRCLNIEEAVSRLRRREVRDRSSGLSKALGWVVDALRREECGRAGHVGRSHTRSGERGRAAVELCFLSHPRRGDIDLDAARLSFREVDGPR